MNLHMLYEESMPPKPKEIRVTHDFGEISIHTDGASGMASGRHIVVEGMARDFCKWLGGQYAWIGDGPPMFQQFKRRLIAEEPDE